VLPHAPGESDLSAIPGNLVGVRTCKVVRANPRTRTAKVRGAGRVKLAARVPARVLAGAPVKLSLAARRRAVRAVTYRIGGRRVAASKRAPFLASVRPAALRLGKRQPLVALVRPRRGAVRQVRMTLDVGECPSVLTAAVRFSGSRAITRVRVDSRFSIESAAVAVPASLALRRVKPGRRAGTLTLTGLGGRKLSAPLVGGRGTALYDAGGVTVRRAGRKLVLSGVPAGYGIASLDVFGQRRPALKLLGGRKPLRFTASLRAAGLGTQRLVAAVRPHAQRR
jgi:hypothetical protein